MAKTLEFPVLLRLIDERAVAFRAAVASAPSLEAQVPTCPEWTLWDLVQHLGMVHRRWAATVAAGPADAPPVDMALPAGTALPVDMALPAGTALPVDMALPAGTASPADIAPPTETAPADAPAAPREREALLAWWAESTQQLLTALRESGPDRGCWTWWDSSESPQTCGAVARHQLQEVAVYTYDAQITLGAAQPLPDEAAVDGVDEFLSTCCAGAYAWPHESCAVEYHAVEGGSWRLALSAGGVRLVRLPTSAATSAATPAGTSAATPAATSAAMPAATSAIAADEDSDAADVALTGTASELVLALCGRIPVSSLTIDGDPRLFDLLLAWDPDE